MRKQITDEYGEISWIETDEDATILVTKKASPVLDIVRKQVEKIMAPQSPITPKQANPPKPKQTQSLVNIEPSTTTPRGGLTGAQRQAKYRRKPGYKDTHAKYMKEYRARRKTPKDQEG